MKKLKIILVIIIAGTTLFGQTNHRPVTLNPNSGYITINELNLGYGLGTSFRPYSKQFYGLTTMYGYQLNLYGLNVNCGLQGGLGTGVLFYNKDYLFPLYLDVRFFRNKKKASLFIFGDAGLLISIEDFNGQTRLFINGGGGVHVKIDNHLALNIAPGLLIQMGNSVSRDAFVNLKAGVSFKPR
jgi:hypothetical protein